MRAYESLTILVQPKGVFYAPSTSQSGTRMRTYSTTVSHPCSILRRALNCRKAYLLPNQHRENLIILPAVHVSRILTHKGSDGILAAVSVEFMHDRQFHAASVRKEVILSAG